MNSPYRPTVANRMSSGRLFTCSPGPTALTLQSVFFGYSGGSFIPSRAKCLPYMQSASSVAGSIGTLWISFGLLFSRRVPYGIRNVRYQTFNLIRYENMSGHSEDPVAEESKRFFTFFNLSMILVAITGVEIVIIYVQTFEGSSIIGILFLTSILKFIRCDLVVHALTTMGQNPKHHFVSFRLGDCSRNLLCRYLHG